MNPSVSKWVTVSCLVALGAGLATGGIYVGDTDDAPGAALLGILLALGLLAFSIRTARRKTE